MKKISIIVPVYNVGGYIKQCVDSLLKQTYQDLEIILIDDGSTDCSGEICDELAQNDARLKVFHLENGGVSRARNKGLEVATGDLIAFVDGDDWVEPDIYEKLLNASEDKDISFCRFSRDYPDGHKMLHEETSLENFIQKPWDISYMLYESLYQKSIGKIQTDIVFGSVCRSLFKKKIIQEKNIRFQEDVKLAEDALFLMEYLSHCDKAGMVDEYLYHYRSERKDSATAKMTSGKQEALYKRKKELHLKEIALIQNNLKMENNAKDTLITYLQYKLCFDVVINEILFNDHYKKELKELFQDDLLKNALSNKSFRVMKWKAVPFRRRIFYRLIQFRLWGLLGFLLRKRN